MIEWTERMAAAAWALKWVLGFVVMGLALGWAMDEELPEDLRDLRPGLPSTEHALDEGDST